jgi:hypothetical protein
MFINARHHDRRLTLNFVTFTRSAVGVRCPFIDREFIDYVYALPDAVLLHPQFHHAVTTRLAPRLTTIPRDRDWRLPHPSPWVRTPHALWRRGLGWLGRHGVDLTTPHATLYADYENYLRHELRPWAERLLFDERTLARGFYDVAALRALWQRHLDGRELHTIGKLAPLMAIRWRCASWTAHAAAACALDGKGGCRPDHARAAAVVRRGREAPVDALEFVEFVFEGLGATARAPGRPGRVVEHPLHCRARPGRVDLEEQPVVVVPHEFGDTADARAYDRNAKGLGFEDHVGTVLGPARRHHHHVEIRQGFPDLVAVYLARPRDAVALRRNVGSQRRRVAWLARRIAPQRETTRVRAGEAAPRAEQQVDALVRLDLAQVADAHGGVGHTRGQVVWRHNALPRDGHVRRIQAKVHVLSGDIRRRHDHCAHVAEHGPLVGDPLLEVRDLGAPGATARSRRTPESRGDARRQAIQPPVAPAHLGVAAPARAGDGPRSARYFS